MAKDLEVEALRHTDAKRRNIPTAEFQSVMEEDERRPVRVAYDKRDPDLDPQLIWRGKFDGESDRLSVAAPPLYIQEKIHPKVLIEDLKRETKRRVDKAAKDERGFAFDLFADFNGLPDKEAATEFYAHDSNWTNRMILGDSLSVMASLAEREGLRGKVQCVYLDPPYGIKFNSNFQWSTTSRDVKDGNKDHVTREPEQVRAFRDTWRDGIHSYLTYLRDRLIVAKDLLADSGSIFVQIGDENVHRVRALMDEVFGEDNFIVCVTVKKKGSQKGEFLENVADSILFYVKDKECAKYRHLWGQRDADDDAVFSADLTGGGTFRTQIFDFKFSGRTYCPSQNNSWKTNYVGMQRISRASRILIGKNQIRYARKQADFGYSVLTNIWEDTGGASDRIYVVQTAAKIIQRCILMATDPGDLVLDPTCGSGTTAYVAEQWGRRWITIDTSRVALALARARIMGARYPFYLLADSREGQVKEGEVTRTPPKTAPTRGDIRHGFVYERVPHITLKSIANNSEIDVIWDEARKTLEPPRADLNAALGTAWEEWEIPREADPKWPATAKELHARWWEARIKRQRDIDASIAAKADFEYLYDKPYVDTSKVRVAGPFTVESLSPHRALVVDEDEELIDLADAAEGKRSRKAAAEAESDDFVAVILENLRVAGVQQVHKENRIAFTSLTGWPGGLICAEGRFLEGERERRAGILIGPEFGTVSRPDLVAAAREAGDAGFDLLIACAFNYDAHSAEFDKLGRIPVLKARMNPDLHMGGELKANGTGNLFVIFGEPDIEILRDDDGRLRVRIKGVDVFKPSTGEIESSGPEGIAVWCVDTDYNEESFFVRHAYFLGAQDPYKALKTTLRAEIDEEAWTTLHSDVSRPFDKPASGRVAVKVINHLGDEVMKVFSVR